MCAGASSNHQNIQWLFEFGSQKARLTCYVTMPTHRLFLVSCQSFTANTCRPLKVGSADLLVSVEAATLQGGPRAQIKSWSSSELLAINVCLATVSSQVSFQPPYRLAPHYSLAQSWSHPSVIIIPAMLALNASTPYFHWEYSLIWDGGWKHAGIPQGLGDLSKLL